MTLLSLTKKEESSIVDYVVVDEIKPKKVVPAAKKPKKKPVVETPDFFAFEKHENNPVSTHDIPAPDPPKRSWRDGKIVIDENNIRKM